MTPFQPAHPFGEVAAGCAQTQVKVIPHQTERLNLPTKTLTGFAQNLPESFSSSIALENEPAEIPAIDHVIAGISTDHSKRARHLQAKVTNTTRQVESKN